LKFRDEHSTVATIHIAYMGIRQSFTTENAKIHPREMRIRLQHGPFAELEGDWSFLPLGDDACKVEFRLQYVFSSRVLETILAPGSAISPIVCRRFVRRPTRSRHVAANISVEVIYALPQQQPLLRVSLAEGATVEDAIRLSGVLEAFPEIDLGKNKVGIFSKLVKLDEAVRDKDRVEIYRPLIADPKEVRRKRAEEGKVTRKGGGDAAPE